MSTKALTGIKVADFSWIGVGCITSKYLANHGATVVHVEAHNRPDLLRLSHPTKDGVGEVVAEEASRAVEGDVDAAERAPSARGCAAPSRR